MITANTLYTYKAKVVSIYDGDSLRLDIDLGFKIVMQNQRGRLLGIDTPELRGDERESGLVARDYMRDLLLGKEVIITTIKDSYGKYGRWLIEVFLPDETQESGFLDVNKHLISEGLAVPYEK
jgi:micrococcal nuclease